MRFRKLGWLTATFAVLAIVLYFGLQPKGLPDKNAVVLDKERGTLSFDKHGLAYVENFRLGKKNSAVKGFTLEMVVRSDPPVDAPSFDSLLMIHDGSDRRQLIVGQWKSSLVVMNGNDYDHSRRLPRLVGKDVFSPEKERWIAIVAKESGTRLFVDGALRSFKKGWQLTVPGQGAQARLVLGNAVTAKNGWRGEVGGMAIHAQPLSPAVVRQQFADWQRSGRFVFERTDHLRLLHTFRQRNGNRIPDVSGNHHALLVPERLFALDKRFLELPFFNGMRSVSFVQDAALNFIGFIPFGAVLYGLFGSFSLPRRYALPAVVLTGCLLSLGIEIGQAWLPTRSSSLVDLVLNTMGAWAGAWGAARVRWLNRSAEGG